MLLLVIQMCALCDELAIRFMLAADQARDARRCFCRAVTVTQQAIAETYLQRAQSYEAYAGDELRSHRERCLLVVPEVEQLVASIR